MKNSLFFIFLSIILLSLLPGFFACDSNKIKPGFSPNSSSASQVNFQHVVAVEAKKVIRMYEAAGTIRPLTESIIESQISAKIIKIFCVPGTRVKKDQTLIQIDSRHLATRLKQAKEGLSMAQKQESQAQKSINAAMARLDQTESAYHRSKKLFESAIISSHKLEQDKSAFLQAKAQLEKNQQAKQAVSAGTRQAREIVKEANIALGYAKITSPADGIVAQRLADPGDIAVPGKPLLILQTSGSLRLEAHVREGLINRVKKREPYSVRIETIQKTIVAQVEEILPYADPDTRTFLVKASLPQTPGIFPGMFGRLLIPLDAEKTIIIPQKAITRIGQLELVQIKNNNQWQSVYIKTGRRFNDKIEVLSGLFGNETIGY